MRARFGAFLLDDDAKQLFRGEQPVHLTPKGYAFLEYLVRQGPRAVSKAEILERLWPGRLVSQAALTSVVKELRQALGDPAGAPGIVRGVRGFGYALRPDPVFLTEPRAGLQAPAPEYRVLFHAHEVALSEGVNLLGRVHEAVVWVDDASVSRRHAVIRIEGRRATLEDCGSKNGTFVGRERVVSPRELAPGDEIWLGHANLVFLAYSVDVPTDPLHTPDVADPDVLH
jgi:DNA-binding winged helix-turn-helix (wHTH) protein